MPKYVGEGDRYNSPIKRYALNEPDENIFKTSYNTYYNKAHSVNRSHIHQDSRQNTQSANYARLYGQGSKVPEKHQPYQQVNRLSEDIYPIPTHNHTNQLNQYQKLQQYNQ